MEKRTLAKCVMPVLLSVLAISAKGQTKWVYTYDNAGNRIQRVVNTAALARQDAATSTSDVLVDNMKMRVMIDVNRTSIIVEIPTFCSSDVAEVSVYNMSGIRMLSQRINSETTSLNLGKLRRGTYILSVIINGEIKKTKFSK